MKNKHTYTFTFFMACAIFALSGCGASKKNLAITKNNTKEKKDLTVFEQNDILSSFLINKVDTEIHLEPINPLNPIILNDSTSIQNAKVVIKKKEDKSQIEIRDNTSKKTVDKGTKSEKKKERSRQVEREGFSWNGLKSALIWIAVIVVLGGILYLRKTGKKLF